MAKDEDDLYSLFDAVCEKHENSFVLDNACGVPMCVVSIDDDNPPVTQITHSVVVPDIEPDETIRVERAVAALSPFSMYGFFQVKPVNDAVICTYTQRIVDGCAQKRMVYRKALCDGLLCLRSVLYEVRAQSETQKMEGAQHE